MRARGIAGVALSALIAAAFTAAISACNQPIARPGGGGGTDTDSGLATLEFLAIETGFSAAPEIAPAMTAGTPTVLTSRAEANNPGRSYFVLYPDAPAGGTPGGAVRVSMRAKLGAIVRGVSANGVTVTLATDEPPAGAAATAGAAANEDDPGDDDEEPADGDDDPDGGDDPPEEPADTSPMLTYAFTIGRVGYTVLKITVGADDETTDYTITLQPATGGGGGNPADLQALEDKLYNNPAGDITILQTEMSTQIGLLSGLAGRLGDLELDAGVSMLDEKTLDGGAPTWTADISGAEFIYIQFSDSGRFHPVLKTSLGATSIPLNNSGGTASFSVATDDGVDTLTITVAGGSATPLALYTGNNNADYQSLRLLKQQIDLLDAAIAATYLKKTELDTRLSDYYTQTAADATFTKKAELATELAAYLTSADMGTFTNAAAINSAIATAISNALGWTPGQTVAAKIEAVKDALEDSLSDLGGDITTVSEALEDLTDRVAELESSTGALVLAEETATLLRVAGFASSAVPATQTALNTYFKAGKHYYYALDGVTADHVTPAKRWLNLPLDGALTGTLAFTRAGDILTVTLTVSCVDTTAYQYREYKGMWLLNAGAFAWQTTAAGAAPTGWIPVVTGAVVSVDTIDFTHLVTGSVWTTHATYKKAIYDPMSGMVYITLDTPQNMTWASGRPQIPAQYLFNSMLDTTRIIGFVDSGAGGGLRSCYIDNNGYIYFSLNGGAFANQQGERNILSFSYNIGKTGGAYLVEKPGIKKKVMVANENNTNTLSVVLGITEPAMILFRYTGQGSAGVTHNATEWGGAFNEGANGSLLLVYPNDTIYITNNDSSYIVLVSGGGI